MTTYKEINGTNIESLEDDPSNPVEGQVWYNTTARSVRGFAGPLAGSWATANSMNTQRFYLAGAGTQAAALAFGGAPGTKVETELWNGTNWTEVNNLNTGRSRLGGSGASNTAA